MIVPEEGEATLSKVPAKGFPVSGNRSFLAIWVAQLLARIGNGLTPFALSIWAYQETGRSGPVALVALAGFLPAVLLSPIAGVLADRFSRKRLMLLSNAGFAVSLVMLLVVFGPGGGALVYVCLALAFGSACASLLEPAYRAIVTDLLAPAAYARASGMVQLASAAQFLVSPVVAGVLMAHTGIVHIVQIDLALTALATIGMLVIRVPDRPKFTEQSSAWREFRAGVQFLVTHQGIRGMLVLATLITFCLGILQTLLTPLMLDLAGEEAVGIVRSLAAVGLLLSSLIIGVFSMGGRHVRYMSAALVLGGVAIVLMGIANNVVWIGIFCFAFFLVLPPLNTSVEVLTRSAIPNELQGKMWGLIGLVSQLGYVAAYALAGVLADAVFNPLLTRDGSTVNGLLSEVYGVGPSRGIGVLFGLVGLVLVVVGALMSRLRSVRRLETSFNQIVNAADVTG